ncbi:hypothetical protein CLIB1423_09S04676 [[Candida] railenensis]|uniref:Uncharacterized protein n=1 Tax=[Candida] railenensis TaxID=45579 RepID=A0A9P0VYN3_9ASCO|nr:hypothetical protein CLIB1423_09S04676 [[Candida] railenensis]
MCVCEFAMGYFLVDSFRFSTMRSNIWWRMGACAHPSSPMQAIILIIFEKFSADSEGKIKSVLLTSTVGSSNAHLFTISCLSYSHFIANPTVWGLFIPAFFLIFNPTFPDHFCVARQRTTTGSHEERRKCLDTFVIRQYTSICKNHERE